MITIEEAIVATYDFLDKIPYHKSIKENSSIEEVELAEEEYKKIWKITLGFPGKTSVVYPLGTPKSYKVFYVDAETGIVNKMKIREEEI